MKADAEDNLREDLELINAAAKAAADEIAGIEDKFVLPRNQSLQVLRAKAVSFRADGEALKAALIEAVLPWDFLIDLDADIAVYDAADTVGDGQAEAVGRLKYLFKRRKAPSRKLAAHVKIKYRNSPSKRAAYLVASHVERSSPRPPKTTVPTPQPARKPFLFLIVKETKIYLAEKERKTMKDLSQPCETANDEKVCNSRRAFFVRATATASGLMLALSSANAQTAKPNDAKTATATSGDIMIKLDAKSELGKVGGFQTVEQDGTKIVVVRVSETEFKAYSAVCPHKGGPIKYDAATSQLFCPWHNSRFDLTGAVVKPPAKTGLAMYEAQNEIVVTLKK